MKKDMEETKKETLQRIKVKVIMEKGKDGNYSCYTDHNFKTFSVAGYGASVEEAKADFEKAYQEEREMEAEAGRQAPEIEIEWRYDIQSFFKCFDYLKISNFAKKAGMNASLLRQYASGCAKAGEGQFIKLRAAIKAVAKELEEATL